MPDGYMFVEAPNLPALIRTVPDSILLDVQPALVPGTLQRVDLTVPAYQIRIDYELCVPMTFGPQLSILYRDTVDNLAKDIRDFVDKVQEVKILATVDNTVPLTLQAAAIARGRPEAAVAGRRGVRSRDDSPGRRRRYACVIVVRCGDP